MSGYTMFTIAYNNRHHNSKFFHWRQYIAAGLQIFHVVLQFTAYTINAHYFKCHANVHFKNITDLFLITYIPCLHLNKELALMKCCYLSQKSSLLYSQTKWNLCKASPLWLSWIFRWLPLAREMQLVLFLCYLTRVYVLRNLGIWATGRLACILWIFSLHNTFCRLRKFPDWT